MRALLTCSVAVVLLCIVSCDQSNRVLLPNPGSHPDVADRIILLDDPFDTRFPEDPVKIEGASIQGDLLAIKVVYGGGCKTHQFALYGSTGFMESYPVQARLFLSHDSNGDMCEAIIRHDIVFDLSPLKRLYQKGYHGSGPIMLRITEPGTDAPLEPLPLYEF